ncbi:MAG: DUF2914 domain-containing protein [Methylococcales bacterium]|nr:DUF2914 domain-containing protein [Methylococcales bacterium]MBT7443790.1 DUF2914 domain-containing protein [Methylococcales bacterium]
MSDKSIKIRIKLDTHHPESDAVEATASAVETAQPSRYSDIDPKRLIRRDRHQARFRAKVMLVTLFAAGLSAGSYWWSEQQDALEAPIAASDIAIPTVTEAQVAEAPTVAEPTVTAAIKSADNHQKKLIVQPDLAIEADVVVTAKMPVAAQIKQNLTQLAETQLQKTLTQPNLFAEVEQALPQLAEATVAPEKIQKKVNEVTVAVAPIEHTVIQSRHIGRAMLTNAIAHREPVDEVLGTVFARNDITRMYYFTELKGLKGQVVTHHWVLNGKVMAKIRFRIGSHHWRTYSSKYLNQKMLGDWKVVVMDSQGKELSHTNFSYQPAPEALSQR